MQNVYQYAGYNLHVCLVCDGYEIIDKVCGLFVGSEIGYILIETPIKQFLGTNHQMSRVELTLFISEFRILNS